MPHRLCGELPPSQSQTAPREAAAPSSDRHQDPDQGEPDTRLKAVPKRTALIEIVRRPKAGPAFRDLLEAVHFTFTQEPGCSVISAFSPPSPPLQPMQGKAEQWQSDTQHKPTAD